MTKQSSFYGLNFASGLSATIHFKVVAYNYNVYFNQPRKIQMQL